MKHGSLFSGIGGFDLAAEWMGWENVFHCEWNPFGQKVLKYYWPNAISYEDITKTDFTVHRADIDILTGGFPCQPYSMAGKRKGKEDERHLWPQMLRAIREIEPRWIVGENVYGLVNWSEGLVFHEVQSDLETAGYEVQPFLLPAAGVNAPHRRDRIWFVAYCNRNGLNECNGEYEVNTSERWKYALRDTQQSNDDGDAANTMYERLQRRSEIDGWEKHNSKRSGNRFDIGANRENNSTYSISNFFNFPTVSPICHGDDGISNELDGITFSKWRTESIKAGGNAIVPQVAYQIFLTIQQMET